MDRREVLGKVASLGGAFALLGAAALTSPVEARRGGGGGDRIRKSFRMFTVGSGAASRTKGKAEIEARLSRGREKFKVEVESLGLTDGTVVNVFARKAGGESIFVEALTLHSLPRSPRKVKAELELDTEHGDDLPASVSPVTDNTEVSVQLAATNETILTTTRG